MVRCLSASSRCLASTVPLHSLKCPSFCQILTLLPWPLNVLRASLSTSNTLPQLTSSYKWCSTICLHYVHPYILICRLLVPFFACRLPLWSQQVSHPFGCNDLREHHFLVFLTLSNLTPFDCGLNLERLTNGKMDRQALLRLHCKTRILIFLKFSLLLA